MKIKTMGIVLVLLALVAFLGGCGCFYQAQKGEAPPPKPPEAKFTPPAAKKEVPVTPATVVELKDVNFDFDKYNIRSGDAEILKENHGWYKKNPGRKTKIEGHCDERGTVEYNLALGQKRADSTKNYLVKLGVDGKMIETVSYGKEKPLCMEHNENCWAKNRRAHFLVLP